MKVSTLKHSFLKKTIFTLLFLFILVSLFPFIFVSCNKKTSTDFEIDSQAPKAYELLDEQHKGLSLLPKIPAIIPQTTTIPQDEQITFWSDYPPEELAPALADRMTDEELLSQLLMFGWSGDSPSQQLKDWVSKRHIGSIKVYGWRTENLTALSKTIYDFQKESQKQSLQIPLFVATDQEGGWIRHVKGNTTETPGNLAIGASGIAYDAYETGYYIGMELRALGINMNFAPTIDLYTNLYSSVIGPRSFGEDPKETGNFGVAFTQGHLDAGVIPTAKHFPGHGDTTNDSHGILPIIRADLETVENRELVPFQILCDNGVPAIMSGHLAFPKLTDGKNIPATLSAYFLQDLLREKMGFTGLIITDDMMMNGATMYAGSLSTSVYQAFKAGNDIVISSTTPNLDDAIWTRSFYAMENDKEFYNRIRESAIRVLYAKLLYLKNTASVPLYPDYENLDQTVPAQGAKEFSLEQACRSVTQLKKEIVPYSPNEDEKILIASEFSDFLSEGKLRFPQATTYYISPNKTTQTSLSEIAYRLKDKDTLIFCVAGSDTEYILKSLSYFNGNCIAVSSLAPIYIKNLKWVKDIIAIYSYAPSSFKAAFAAIKGDFVPQGKMPLNTLKNIE